MAYKQAADEVGLTIAEVGVWRNTLDINLYAQLATAENPRMRNFPIIQPCPKLVIRYVLRLHLVLAGDGHEVPGLFVDCGRSGHTSTEQCLDGVGTDGLIRVLSDAGTRHDILYDGLAVSGCCGLGLLFVSVVAGCYCEQRCKS